MHALVLEAKDQAPIHKSVADPTPAENEVVVQLKAAALNHRDVYITQSLYPKISYPVILGSDGAGLVGDREVLINPSLSWGDNPNVQAEDYSILGMPSNGTFAEQVVVPTSQIYDKPGHLSFAEAAALPLAGLTAYRALFTKCQLQVGERVLISGVGGGVALFAMQFAVALGAEVFVTSGSEAKIEKAIVLGAKGGVNYKAEQWHKALLAKAGGGFDVVIDSAGGAGFANFPKICNPGGRIAFYGGTRGNIQNLNPQIIFWKQLSIFGSTMGNDEDFRGMLDLVNTHRIQPVIDQVFPLREGVAALDRMDQGLQFGKIVLEI